MKRFLLTVILGLITLTQIQAQQTVVYFKSLSSEIGIGLGTNAETQQKILGIVQYTKKTNISDFSIKFIDKNGQEKYLPLQLKIDTVIHWTDKKTKIHEAHYLLHNGELQKLVNVINTSKYVIINNHEFAASELQTMLTDLLKFQYPINELPKPNQQGFAIIKKRRPLWGRPPYWMFMWHRK